MPNTREKLSELLGEFCPYKEKRCVGCTPGKYYHPECKNEQFGKIADHLIANGVTFQNRDIHWATEQAYKNGYAAGCPKWISVKDRLPESIGLFLVIEKHWIDGSPCRRIAKWNTEDWFTADRKSKEITPRVTHWMPLPEPPKGE